MTALKCILSAILLAHLTGDVDSFFSSSGKQKLTVNCSDLYFPWKIYFCHEETFDDKIYTI